MDLFRRRRWSNCCPKSKTDNTTPWLKRGFLSRLKLRKNNSLRCWWSFEGNISINIEHFWGCGHISVDSSVPAILMPRVQVPNAFIIYSQICAKSVMWKERKWTKRSWFWPFFIKEWAFCAKNLSLNLKTSVRWSSCFGSCILCSWTWRLRIGKRLKWIQSNWYVKTYNRM